MSKRLYVAGEYFESRELENHSRKLAREKSNDLLSMVSIDADTCKSLASILKGLNDHSPARKILSCIRQQDPKDVRAAQQLALTTYKDEELPPDARLDDALSILEAIGLRDSGCKDPETLGLGGAIYKRRWERDR